MGGALGLAVLATLSTTRTSSLIQGGRSTASALTSGYHIAFLAGAGLVAAATLLAVIVLSSETHPTNTRHAKLDIPETASVAAA